MDNETLALIRACRARLTDETSANENLPVPNQAIEENQEEENNEEENESISSSASHDSILTDPRTLDEHLKKCNANYSWLTNTIAPMNYDKYRSIIDVILNELSSSLDDTELKEYFEKEEDLLFRRNVKNVLLNQILLPRSVSVDPNLTPIQMTELKNLCEVLSVDYHG